VRDPFIWLILNQPFSQRGLPESKTHNSNAKVVIKQIKDSVRLNKQRVRVIVDEYFALWIFLWATGHQA
jgi:hypothetical protein